MKGKLKASEIVCHKSSFAKTPAAKVPLPAPCRASEEKEEVPLKPSEFLVAVVGASNKRVEIAQLAKAAVAERRAKALAYTAAQTAKAQQVEEARLAALSPQDRQAEEQAESEAREEDRARGSVAQAMQAQQGTGVVLLLPQHESADAAIVTLGNSVRRSSRVRGAVRVNADDVQRLKKTLLCLLFSRGATANSCSSC